MLVSTRYFILIFRSRRGGVVRDKRRIKKLRRGLEQEWRTEHPPEQGDRRERGEERIRAYKEVQEREASLADMSLRDEDFLNQSAQFRDESNFVSQRFARGDVERVSGLEEL